MRSRSAHFRCNLNLTERQRQTEVCRTSRRFGFELSNWRDLLRLVLRWFFERYTLRLLSHVWAFAEPEEYPRKENRCGQNQQECVGEWWQPRFDKLPRLHDY